MEGSLLPHFFHAQEYAKQAGFPFLETSAKDGSNIVQAFRMMATAIREGTQDHEDLKNGGKSRTSLPEANKLELDAEEHTEPSHKNSSCCKG